MKVIIAGSRNCTNFELLREKCDKILSKTDMNTVEFISGGCRGVDKLGEQYAKSKGKTPIIYPANWKKYGKAAGPLRNLKMAENATHLIAFLEPGSKGTASMIKEAEKLNLKIRKILI